MQLCVGNTRLWWGYWAPLQARPFYRRGQIGTSPFTPIRFRQQPLSPTSSTRRYQLESPEAQATDHGHRQRPKGSLAPKARR